MRQGKKYGTMAVDLSLVHISMAASKDAVQDHITNLARNISERAGGILLLSGRRLRSKQFRHASRRPEGLRRSSKIQIVL